MTLPHAAGTRAYPKLRLTSVERIVDALSYLVLAGGLVTIAAALRLAVVAYSRIPYWDMWAMVHYLVHPDRPLLQWMWAQHNEHRIVTAKVLFAIDFHLFHGTEKFLLATGFLLLSAHVVVLAWAARSLSQLRGAAWRTAVGLSAFCLFCPSQWENFTTGFQVCFFLLLFFVTAAAAAAVRFGAEAQESRSSPAYLLWALAAAAAATFSLGNGLLIWPVLLLVAVLQRYRARTILALVGTALAATGVDLFQYHRMTGRSDPLRSFRQPWRVVEYVLKYLGAPWVESDLRWAMFFGGLAVTATVLAVCGIMVQRRRAPARVLISALLVFYLATPAATALARQMVGTDQGAASARYEAFALMLWLTLGLLALDYAARRPAGLLLMQTIVIAVMLLAATRVRFPLRVGLWRAMINNSAGDAMLAGTFDPQAFTHVAYGPLDRVWSDVGLLKAQHKSIFAGAQAKQLGAEITRAHVVGAEDCWGDLHAEPVGSPEFRGMRVTGWAWDPLRQRALTDLLFSTGGRIAGFGQGGFPRRDLDPPKARYSAFVGFTPTVDPGAIVAYGVLASHELCHIQSQRAPP